MRPSAASTSAVEGAARRERSSDPEPYQDRLARCLASYAWIVTTLAIVVAVPYLAFPDVRERILPLPALVALARVPVLALAVVVLRTWRLAGGVLVATEVALTFVVMTLGSVPLAWGTRDLALDLSAIPWLLLLLALRVGLLRAPTRRELVVSIAAAAPLMVAATVRTLHDESLDPHHPGWVAIVVVGVWSAAGIAVATYSTRAFGKLRDAVEQARRLGPYTIEAKIGQGGMGAVYRAHHALLRRPAAIKILRPRATGEMDFERFELEATQTSRLSHPNIVSVFDYGRTPDGGFYYVMEYLDGYNLQELVAHHGPLPVGRALHVLVQVCSALAEAHGLGLVHRDIKPANIVLTSRLTEPDVVKVVDFGLVHARGHRSPERSIVGTLGYMAPETLRGRNVDARADIYAFGAMAHFVLTGREVFTGDDREIVHRHLLEQPSPPSSLAPGLPPELDAVVLRCLQKEPESRFASASELREALAELAARHPHDASAGRAWWRVHAIREAGAVAEGGSASGLPYLETVPIDLRRRAGDTRPTEPDSPRGLRALSR